MRIEQIFAVVTRTLVVAIVREIRCVVSFAAALRLHLWQLRMSLGMPSYSGTLPPTSDPDGGAEDARCFRLGGKRGNKHGQFVLAMACCQPGTASA